MADTVNRTLSRGLCMLELLGEHPDGLELNQIAKLLELPKSTAFNLVHTLLDLRYIQYLPETARYRLGLRMFEVGSAAIKDVDTTAIMRQYMNEIQREINETVHCGLFSGEDIIYIDKLESTRSIRMTSHVGTRAPLYSTAMGKAVLGALSNDEIEALYGHMAFQPFTKNTVKDMEQLNVQVQLVRKFGYAAEREEYNENVGCVGVSIKGRDMRPQYALSVSVPSFRFDDEKEQIYGKLLLRAQRKIERFLQAM